MAEAAETRNENQPETKAENKKVKKITLAQDLTEIEEESSKKEIKTLAR